MGKGTSSVIYFLVLIAVGTTVVFLFQFSSDRQIDDGFQAICIDCAPGHLGGGCTHTDENGKMIHPGQCMTYDTSRIMHFCTRDNRTANCSEHSRRVCGNDGNEYLNPCSACRNVYVAFYIDSECSKITGENAGKQRGEQVDPKIDYVDEYKIYPQVWSFNGYSGQSYEYKVNCFGNYSKLEECFLWDLTKVLVTSTNGTVFILNKDFNIQNYSGEITRRWVLYGPLNGSLPANGQYVFGYYKNEKLVLEQKVDYFQEIMDYPKNVTWMRDGNGITVSWTPAAGMRKGMTYKVGVTRADNSLVTKVFEWNASSARMENLPLAEGEKGFVSVGSFFSNGYTSSEYIPIEWK